jgi:hypothetical protein
MDSLNLFAYTIATMGTVAFAFAVYVHFTVKTDKE